MKKLVIYLPLLFVLSLFTLACSDSHDDPEITVDPPMGSALTILSEASPLIGSTGGVAEIEFESRIAWTAYSDQTWCVLSDTQGKAGTHTLMLTIAATEEYDQRTATVTLKAGKTVQTVKITQMQKDAILLARDPEIYSHKAGVVEFRFDTNVSGCEVTSDPDCTWFRYLPATRGLQPVTLRFEIDANDTGQERSTYLTIRKDDIQQTVRIVQLPEPVVAKISFVITHDVGFVPNLSGSFLSKGTIHWGDGVTIAYRPEYYHPYADQQSEHTIEVESTGIEEVHFQKLTGIKQIDLSHL